MRTNLRAMSPGPARPAPGPPPRRETRLAAGLPPRLVTRPLLVRFVSTLGTAASFYLMLSTVPEYTRAAGAGAGTGTGQQASAHTMRPGWASA